jgi:hypothetical protein
VMMFGARADEPRADEPHLMNESAWTLRALTVAAEYFLGYFALGFMASALWLIGSLRTGKIYRTHYPPDASN